MSSTIHLQRPMNLKLPTSISSATERVQIFEPESDKPFVHETGKETITFSNGGTLSETYGEPGLKLTHPDGREVALDGAIRERKGNLEILLWGHKDRFGVGSDTWLQRITPDGEVSFENTRYGGHHLPYTEATVYTTNVDADGSASSSATSSQGRPFTPDISYQDGNVIYKGFGATDLVVTSPVPMEWLLGK